MIKSIFLAFIQHCPLFHLVVSFMFSSLPSCRKKKNLITSQDRVLWIRERKSASSHIEANMVMAGKWVPWEHCSWKALWGRAWPGRLFTMATGERSLIYGQGGASVPSTLVSFEACSSPPKLISHCAHHRHLGLRVGHTSWTRQGQSN